MDKLGPIVADGSRVAELSTRLLLAMEGYTFTEIALAVPAALGLAEDAIEGMRQALEASSDGPAN